METLGKFAASHVMTLARMASAIPSGVSLIRRSGRVFRSLSS